MKNVKIFAKTIELEAKEQIERMAASEAYRDCQIRIMPDCHAGKGCTIGTVIQTAGKVVFTTRHNYFDIHSGIIRKGAVRAENGEQLIIPLNMRDGSLLCTGKGNDDWLQSAPHGAGRLMSRSAAKKQLSMEEYRQQMHDIYSTSVCESTIDESPMAYKPAEEIESLIADTVEIKKRIKPIYNFKAKE